MTATSSAAHGLSQISGWLSCPVCGDPLELADRSLRCGRRHSFDIARQGYVNLLLRTAPPNADTPDMVAARHRFLTAGWYEPLTHAVAEALAGTSRVLDAGVGTGHHLAAHLAATPDATGLGIDVSPAACRLAARRNPRLGCVVADTWAGLPVRDESVDAVLCVFAPRNPGEFARVLAPGGRLVVVTPSPGHLHELREQLGLLAVEAEKLHRLDSALEAFELTERTELQHSLELSQEAAADLIRMGPNAFHQQADPPAIRTTAAFTVSRFSRR